MYVFRVMVRSVMMAIARIEKSAALSLVRSSPDNEAKDMDITYLHRPLAHPSIQSAGRTRFDCAFVGYCIYAADGIIQ